MIRAAGPGASGWVSVRPAGMSWETGSVTGNCSNVQCAHRIAVHRRVRERRQIDGRDEVLAEHQPSAREWRELARRG